MRYIGAWSWILATPLFLAASAVTASRWNPPYSWSSGNISDLGNATCGIWDTTRPRYVCSPWRGLMNAAIVLTALLIALGAVLAWRGRFSRALLLLTSCGYALAGFFPADINENAHFLGALLIMVLGNIGLFVAAFAVSGALRAWTVAMGGIAVAGTLLFFTQHGLGIGVGGMERVAVFPLLVWASVVGIQTLVGASAASACDD